VWEKCRALNIKASGTFSKYFALNISKDKGISVTERFKQIKKTHPREKRPVK
jgi:hypothetical protein